MTKQKLKEIIYDAQRGAMGCGCCADSGEERQTREEAIEMIWNEMKKLKRRRQKR